jgi:TP901 family phage tail tape measure protein
MAMSNETLKMARIAGLEAAEATDRMTNAIRGFNMEINETNAQRIDDVYSRLAAISASNTDEISTAMTKVASLAHNANMEFETTAAFLA